MSQRRKLPAFDGPERVALADLQHWLNTMPRRANAEPVEYDHRQVRGYLDALEVPLEPLSDKKGSKLYFRMSDLRRQAPQLAAAFRPDQPVRAEA